MPGRNSLTMLKAAFVASEIPASWTMFFGPFQLCGPHVLERILAPAIPETAENDTLRCPSGLRAITVLARAYLVRAQVPFSTETKYRLSSCKAAELA